MWQKCLGHPGPGFEAWAWLAVTFSGLVPRGVGWNPWLYSLPPSGTKEGHLPSMGLGVRAQSWPEPCLTAGLTMLPVPQPLEPAPWAGWGYFWDQAGALGLVSDVPM